VFLGLVAGLRDNNDLGAIVKVRRGGRIADLAWKVSKVTGKRKKDGESTADRRPSVCDKLPVLIKSICKGCAKARNSATVPRTDRGGRSARWWVYVLRCTDGTLYTGITNDPDRRLAQHNAGTASKYTRSRRPVAMVYREPKRTRGAALRREAAIKALPRRQKDALIAGHIPPNSLHV